MTISISLMGGWHSVQREKNNHFLRTLREEMTMPCCYFGEEKSPLALSRRRRDKDRGKSSTSRRGGQGKKGVHPSNRFCVKHLRISKVTVANKILQQTLPFSCKIPKESSRRYQLGNDCVGFSISALSLSLLFITQSKYVRGSANLSLTTTTMYYITSYIQPFGERGENHLWHHSGLWRHHDLHIWVRRRLFLTVVLVLVVLVLEVGVVELEVGLVVVEVREGRVGVLHAVHPAERSCKK